MHKLLLYHRRVPLVVAAAAAGASGRAAVKTNGARVTSEIIAAGHLMIVPVATDGIPAGQTIEGTAADAIAVAGSLYWVRH